MKKLTGLIIMFVAILLVPTAYSGNTGVNGFDASFYRSMIDGTGGFNVPRSTTLRRLSYHFGLNFDYSLNPLSIVNPARNANTNILKNQLMLNFGGALGFTDYLMGSVTVPVAIYQGGESCLNANCSQVANYSGQALGNIRMGLKWGFLKQPKMPLGMAAFGILDLPTGSRKAFLGDGHVGGEIGLAVDRRFKKWALGISSSYRFINKTQVFRSSYNDYINTGAWVSVDLHPRLNILAEAKVSLMPSQLNTRTTEAEFLTGLVYRFGKIKDSHSGFKAHVLGGRRMVNGFGAPDMRLVAGMGWTSKGKPKEEAGALEKPVLDHVVYFPFNRYSMTPRERIKLKNYIHRLRDNLPGAVIVEGHTDLWGEVEHNEQLSERRAETVRDYLIEQGVPASIIEARNYGSSRPVSRKMTLKDQKKNRRSEIYIYKTNSPLPLYNSSPLEGEDKGGGEKARPVLSEVEGVRGFSPLPSGERARVRGAL